MALLLLCQALNCSPRSNLWLSGYACPLGSAHVSLDLHFPSQPNSTLPMVQISLKWALLMTSSIRLLSIGSTGRSLRQKKGAWPALNLLRLDTYHERGGLFPTLPRGLTVLAGRDHPNEIMRVKKGGKGKPVAKADLPTKTCIVCNRPFTW